MYVSYIQLVAQGKVTAGDSIIQIGKCDGMKWSELIPPNIALPPSPPPNPPYKKERKKKRSRKRKKGGGGGLLAGKSLACHNYILNHTKVKKRILFHATHHIKTMCTFCAKMPLSKQRTNKQ